MEHRLKGDDGAVGVLEPEPGAVGIVECDQRFVKIVGEMTDMTSDVGVDEMLQMLAESCTEFRDVDAAVITLDGHHGLRAAATSPGATQAARTIDVYPASPNQLAYRLGEAVTVHRLEDARPWWPEFTNAVLQQGYHSIHALPMSSTDHCIGVLNLFSQGDEPSEDVTHLARPLADIATSGVLQRRRLDEALTTNQQLQQALDSRVVIEQAKGMIAERFNQDPSESFEWLRGVCRTNNLKLREVATAIVNNQQLDDHIMRSTPE